MFGKRQPQQLTTPSSRSAEPSGLTDPLTGAVLEPKQTPGYYPGFHTLDQQNYWDAATRALVLDRVKNIPSVRFFTSDEAATMQAVVDRIFPQDDRALNTRIPIFPFLDERLFLHRTEGYRYEDMPSDEETYRLASRAFDSMSNALFGGPFHALPTLQQETILQDIHDAKPTAAQFFGEQINIKRFWAMLVSDCCTIYYAHPFAWDEIGFGGPAYPRGYMRLEEGEAEPWEVNEQRYDWKAPNGTLSDLPQTAGKQEASHHGQAGTH